MISFKRKSVIIIFLILTGCAAKQDPLYYQCPPIDLPPDPFIAIKSLTPKSKPDEVIKAWVATAYAYRGWNQAVHQQLDRTKQNYINSSI